MLKKYNFDLSEYNSYRLKSICSTALFPENENDFIEVFKDNSTKRIIIGNGNNIILSKEYFKEEFVILNGCFNKVEIIGDKIIAEAGATLLQLSEIALENSLSGFEFFYDIPSSVGGAVVMNAGTKDGEIKDVLLKVRYLDLEDMIIKEIHKDDIDFEYRNSFFQKNKDKVVLKAWLQLQPGNPIEIRDKMDRIKAARWAKQPKEFPNAGSVFKRPKGYYVGAMIDELKLKGFNIGGAMISEKHGGFIINYKNATGDDILNVIKYVQNKVKENFNINLEVEQRII